MSEGFFHFRAGSSILSTAGRASKIWLLVALMGIGSGVQAANFNVDSTADQPDLALDGVCETAQGNCTLRAAVQESNSVAGPDTINLPAGLFLLDRAGVDNTTEFGDLDVTDTVEVLGAGPSQTAIEAVQRAFQVRSGGDLTLRDLTLRGVDEFDEGVQSGCLDIATEDARALADNVQFERVVGQNGAFCISATAGSFEARASTFPMVGGFTALIYAPGGGSASITIRDSLVRQDTGAREFMRTNLSDQDLEVLIEGTTFESLAPGSTGAAFLSFACTAEAERSLTILDSSFSDLLGPGPNPFTAISVLNRPANFDCDLIIRDSEFSGSDEALRIFGIDGDISGINAVIESSTFSGNKTAIALGPVGFQDFGPRDRLFIRNVTFSGNTDFGLRIFNNATAGIYNSTFTDNGIGLSNESINDAFIDNSILADSTTSDCEGDFIGSFNLIENGNCNQTGGQTGTIVTGVDPTLGPLADNGGPVATHALLAGSPAIDSGNPNVPFAESFGQACEPFDARGALRPQDDGNDGSFVCDLGAVEIVGTAPEFDHGDAPAPYATLAADNGARHLIADDRPTLGLIDAEADGLPSAAADGDDLNGIDDEDGVDLPASLLTDSEATVEVTVTCDDITCGGSGLLSAWIDLNLDGDWDDPGEDLVSGLAVSDGVNPVALAIPFDAAEGDSVLRFRIGDDPITSPTGSVLGGEVEDYTVAISRVADDNGNQALIPGMPEPDGLFGHAVAVLGDDLLIGQIEADRDGVPDAGAVQVLERSPLDGWRGVGELTLPDPDPTESEIRFGWAIDIVDGDQGLWAAVGASKGSNPAQANAGAVYLYRKKAGSWAFQQKLNAPITSLDLQRFGSSISLDFDTSVSTYTLAVGAPFQVDDGGPAQGGAVFVYQLDSGGQFQLIDSDCGSPETPCGGTLFPPPGEVIQEGDEFGTDVSIRGGRLLVGAPYMDDGSEAFSGRAFVFERAELQGDGSYNWVFRAALGDPDNGPDAEFGFGVGVADDALIVTAPSYDRGGSDSGRGYLFDLDAQSGDLPFETFVAPGTGARASRGGSNFGDRALAVDANTFGLASSGAACDRVHLYRVEGQSIELLDVIDQPAVAGSGAFGDGLDLDSATRTVVIGAPRVDIREQVNAGAAFSYLGFGVIFADSFGGTSSKSSVRGGSACP